MYCTLILTTHLHPTLQHFKNATYQKKTSCKKIVDNRFLLIRGVIKNDRFSAMQAKWENQNEREWNRKTDLLPLRLDIFMGFLVHTSRYNQQHSISTCEYYAMTLQQILHACCIHMDLQSMQCSPAPPTTTATTDGRQVGDLMKNQE